MLKSNRVSVFFVKNRISFMLAVISALISSAVRMFISLLLKNVVDYISGANDKTISELLITSAFVFFLFAVAALMEYIFLPKYYTRGIYNYRESFFNRLIKKDPGAFLNEETSSYLSMITNDTQKIQTNLLERIPMLIEALVTLAFSIVLMIRESVVLTLISVVLSSIPLVFSLLAGKKLPEREKALSEQNMSYVSRLKDILSGFSIIKSFKAEDNIRKFHSEADGALKTKSLERNRSHLAVSEVGHFLGNVVQISVFLVCAVYSTVTGRITSGTVILFIQLMNFVINPIQSVPQIIAGFKGAFALMDKHEGILEANSGGQGKKRLPDEPLDITVKGMGYSFESGNAAENKALSDINIVFEAGKSYCILGESGSGKSTLLNVVSGVRKGYTGSVSYGNNELRDVSYDSLYENVSVTQQNVFVFNDSIGNNITMYGDFDEKEVDEAIKLSGLSDLIGQKGKDYICGEDGKFLSGGEKQRISVARSILRKQKVLFIDEATSALDPQTAKKVNDSLINLKGVTKIMILHTLDKETLMKCDGVIVMKRGRVAEQGSFKDLMEKKGLCYSLYRLSEEW